MGNLNPADLSLYLVTDHDLSLGRSLKWVVEQAVKGGITMVQLREKNLDTKPFMEEALSFKKLLNKHRIPMIINDRVDVALAVGAGGVHIGQSDMPYEMARQILGDDAIIGLSVETFEQAEKANKLDVDYIGISPVYVTPTKKELTEGLGLEGVRKICEICRHPSVGIGGLNASNSGEVVKAGADGVAVVSAICSAENPELAAKEIREAVEKARDER